MRQQLNNGQLQLGVFHGFEFAWMQQKDPTLKPIMVAAPVHRPLKAYVVVSCNNNSANNMGDLRGKRLALANGTREHARIFVDRRCENEGCTPSKFFDAITNPNTAETALHEVYDNKVQAAIVDGADAIWFGGGDQALYQSQWYATPLFNALSRAAASGAGPLKG